MQSLALGWLVWRMTDSPFWLGLVSAMPFMPSRLSFMREMVGKDDLDNALALNSTAINASRIVGSSVAGILVPIVGEGGCFLINSASFLGVVATPGYVQS